MKGNKNFLKFAFYDFGFVKKKKCFYFCRASDSIPVFRE